jgi:hypothetical protein
LTPRKRKFKNFYCGRNKNDKKKMIRKKLNYCQGTCIANFVHSHSQLY